MKTNEAPEKIYVQLPSRNWIGRTWNETPIKEGDNPNWKNATNIEYTRTDAIKAKKVKLTWKDMRQIVAISDRMIIQKGNLDDKGFYEAVLEQFKAQKGE